LDDPLQATAGAPPGWDCHVHVFEAAEDGATAGHYRPVHRPLEAIEAIAAAHGCGHLVLVQPSVYGADNRLLLQALARSDGRHRGVVVLRGDESQADLLRMRDLGVRGIRFNLVSPVGSPEAEAGRQLRALAGRLRDLDWHVQWYASAAVLPWLADWQRVTGLRFVLDHLAGLGARVPLDGSPWEALADLAANGAWVKLSGWYRLDAQAPYDALHDRIRAVAALFGERLVWGSDWPHTSFAPDALPAYASVRDPVTAALGPQATGAILRNGARLYG